MKKLRNKIINLKRKRRKKKIQQVNLNLNPQKKKKIFVQRFKKSIWMIFRIKKFMNKRIPKRINKIKINNKFQKK